MSTPVIAWLHQPTGNVFKDGECQALIKSWQKQFVGVLTPEEIEADFVPLVVSDQSEIARLREAHLSIGYLPNGMVAKIVSEIVSWGDQCAGGSGRELIPSGPNQGKPYGHTYYEAAAALAALFDDARAALNTEGQGNG
jgi:hypothetical protein